MVRNGSDEHSVGIVVTERSRSNVTGMMSGMALRAFRGYVVTERSRSNGIGIDGQEWL